MPLESDGVFGTPQIDCDTSTVSLGLATGSHEQRLSSTKGRVALEEENQVLRARLAELERALGRRKGETLDSVAVPLWERLGMEGLRNIVSTPENAIVKNENTFASVADSDEEALQFSEKSESGLHHRRTVTTTGTSYFQKYSMSPFNFYKTEDSQLPNTISYDKEEGKSLVLKSHASDCDDQSDRDDQSSLGLQEDLEPEQLFFQSLLDRGSWLVGLLVLQSFSSFILQHNEALLQKHAVIVRFLTMLVGAGGNAGNQASVRVIRGLATGAIQIDNLRPYLRAEFKMGFLLSIILGIAGCIRAGTYNA